MLTLCQLDQNQRWTGETDELDETAPIPRGWVVADPPTLAAGRFAEWWLNAWRITTDPVPVFVSSLADLKAAKLDAAQAEYDRRLAAGFPVGDQTLQVRDADDKANWLTLKDACNEAVGAGFGDQPCALPLRTTANTFIVCTYAEAVATLRDMRTWGSALLGRYWALKDDIKAAADEAALDAIDVTADWP